MRMLEGDIGNIPQDGRLFLNISARYERETAVDTNSIDSRQKLRNIFCFIFRELINFIPIPPHNRLLLGLSFYYFVHFIIHILLHY